MRLIGHLDGKSRATAFSDFLYAQGIKNEIEQDKGDHWALWVHEEEQIEPAKIFLASYLTKPNDTRFQGFSQTARELRQREMQDEVVARKRTFNRGKIFAQLAGYGIGPLTWVLILFSAAVFIFEWLNPGSDIRRLLYITTNRGRHAELTEILNGELWRLITPIFLHFGALHILFNMLWLRDLGSMIEARQSTGRLALLVLVTGVLSNLGQFWHHGSHFGGMSGVIYGLFGYIWIRGRFDPASGLFLHPQTVIMMVIWFFLCYTDWIGSVANTAHAVGLIVGMASGFLSAKLGKI